MATTQREWLRVPTWKGRNPDFGANNFIYQKAGEVELLSIKVGGQVLIASHAL